MGFTPCYPLIHCFKGFHSQASFFCNTLNIHSHCNLSVAFPAQVNHKKYMVKVFFFFFKFHVLMSARQNLLLYLFTPSKNYFLTLEPLYLKSLCHNFLFCSVLIHTYAQIQTETQPHYLSRKHFPNLEPDTSKNCIKKN